MTVFNFDEQQELEMWYSLFCKMENLPENYRTVNHTNYLNEIVSRMYVLVDSLGLNYNDWGLVSNVS